ncbi:MAG: hypothetical protein KF688_10560 [Pirellulales bacterium]|nr:hypothetical protein [Pirellulales bacterium]
MSEVFRFFELASQWMIPGTILLIVLWAAYRRVPMYESFVTGAKEGFDVAVMIIPYLVAILFAIKLFIVSGIFDDAKSLAVWGMTKLGLDEYAEIFDLMPLALTRPLSGSGSRGILIEIFDEHGPDSFLGMVSSLMMGSTETTFYVLTVYFGAVNISKLRHAVPACLTGDAAGIVASIVLGYVLFGDLAANDVKPDGAASPQSQNAEFETQPDDQRAPVAAAPSPLREGSGGGAARPERRRLAIGRLVAEQVQAAGSVRDTSIRARALRREEGIGTNRFGACARLT